MTWHHADASTWAGPETFDAVICVGASHASGGLPQTLEALRQHTAPAGHAVLGDGFWEVPPSAAAQDALQTNRSDLPDLAGLLDRVVAAGWLPISGHTSTAEEWDDYGWSWTGSLIEWALQQPSDNDQDARQALAVAAEHGAAWLRGYRHQLGFLTLVLVRRDRV